MPLTVEAEEAAFIILVCHFIYQRLFLTQHHVFEAPNHNALTYYILYTWVRGIQGGCSHSVHTHFSIIELSVISRFFDYIHH